MKIGIVGCGLIGRRRGLVAQEAGDEVLLVADLQPEAAAQVAGSLQTEADPGLAGGDQPSGDRRGGGGHL